MMILLKIAQYLDCDTRGMCEFIKEEKQYELCKNTGKKA